MNPAATTRLDASGPQVGQAAASLVDLLAARAGDAFDRRAIVDGLAVDAAAGHEHHASVGQSTQPFTTRHQPFDGDPRVIGLIALARKHAARVRRLPWRCD